MNSIGIGVTAVLLGLLAIGLVLLFRKQLNQKRELTRAAAQALVRVATPLFDAPPQRRMEDDGMTGVVEGHRSGEPVQIKVQYATNRSGGTYRPFIGNTWVTMGLRGAQPALKLVEKDELAEYFTDRFAGDVDSPLLDDATKAALMEYAVRGPAVERIEVTKDGVTIKLPDSMQSTPTATESIAKDIERTVHLAERLQKRILSALDEQAHVRVDAGYREGEPLDANEEEDAKAREA